MLYPRPWARAYTTTHLYCFTLPTYRVTKLGASNPVGYTTPIEIQTQHTVQLQGTRRKRAFPEKQSAPEDLRAPTSRDTPTYRTHNTPCARTQTRYARTVRTFSSINKGTYGPFSSTCVTHRRTYTAWASLPGR